MGDAIMTVSNLSGNSLEGVDSRITDLQNKKKELQKTIDTHRRQTNSTDKTFLEDVMNGTPQKQTAPTLQDATLLLFWFGWIVIVITLISVRWFSPGGSWQAGLITLLLLVLVSACLYSLLVQIA